MLIGIIFLIVTSPVLFIQYNFLFEYENTEDISLETEYILPRYNYNTIENFQISIFKPSPNSQTKLPACIILNGDWQDVDFLVMLKKNLIENGFMVITLELDGYNPEVFFKLNSTLNYLTTRPDVSSNQIGIFGHSRGAHYAFHFGSMRRDKIKSVICGNFGSLVDFYQDYYRFSQKYINWNHTLTTQDSFLSNPLNSQIDSSVSRSLPSHHQAPNNLLMTFNPLDPQVSYQTDNFLSNLTDGQNYEFNQRYGAFFNGSARKIIKSSHIFGHLSSVSTPKLLHEELSWLHESLDHSPMSMDFSQIRTKIQILVVSIILGMIYCTVFLYFILYVIFFLLFNFENFDFEKKKWVQYIFSMWVISESLLLLVLFISYSKNVPALVLVSLYTLNFIPHHFQKFHDLWNKYRVIKYSTKSFSVKI